MRSAVGTQGCAGALLSDARFKGTLSVLRNCRQPAMLFFVPVDTDGRTADLYGNLDFGGCNCRKELVLEIIIKISARVFSSEYRGRRGAMSILYIILRA